MPVTPKPVPVGRNFALAGALIAFVGGVYYYTYSKMKSNELSTISADLDEVRKLTAAVNPATKSAAASGSK